jgi:outer membrane protein OmpA-like peptidoglycan-associated protein
MTGSKDNSFWTSYTDLMTSLFFVMLVLYLLTYVKLTKTIKIQKKKLDIIEAVEQNLKPLKTENSLFIYESEFKRYKLAFDVLFNVDRYQISDKDLIDPTQTIDKINQAGLKLKAVIDKLSLLKKQDPKLENVSYIIIIAGYASKSGDKNHNYELSFKRALSLKNHWENFLVDFENADYNGLIDLQIAGNGWGGVGREEDDTQNQRFLIQIFPKIGDIQ